MAVLDFRSQGQCSNAEGTRNEELEALRQVGGGGVPSPENLLNYLEMISMQSNNFYTFICSGLIFMPQWRHYVLTMPRYLCQCVSRILAHFEVGDVLFFV